MGFLHFLKILACLETNTHRVCVGGGGGGWVGGCVGVCVCGGGGGVVTSVNELMF